MIIFVQIFIIVNSIKISIAKKILINLKKIDIFICNLFILGGIEVIRFNTPPYIGKEQEYIRIITGLGFTIFLLSLVALAYSLVVNLRGNTITGWTSLG